MFLTVFHIFGVPAHGTGDIEVDEVYEILDSDKEKEKQNKLLKQKKIENKSNIFNFGQWGWKKRF